MAEKYIQLIDEKPTGKSNVGQPSNIMSSTKYDKYKTPADLQLAEDHFLATRIAKPIKTKQRQNIDDATGLPVENELLPIWCDLEELNFLSPGYPMYFQFLKFAIYVLLTMFVFSGIYNYTTNENGTNCIPRELVPDNVTYDQIITICVKDGIHEYSLANKINNIPILEKQEIYNLFTIVLLFFLLQFLRKIQKETAVVCDERDITASDYTVRLRNFPTDWDSKTDIDDEVKKFFIAHGLPGTKLNVASVSCVYDVADKIKCTKKIEDNITLKRTLIARREAGETISEDEIKRCDQEIKAAQIEIERLSREFEEGKGVNEKFRGEAYVTLETQKEVQHVLKHWKLSLYKQVLERFNPVSAYKYRGKLLEITQAPEPSDILWENAGLEPLVRTARRMGTAVLTGIVLVLCAGMILLVNNEKIDYLKGIKNDEEKGMSLETQVIIQVISIGASVGIVAVNSLLKSLLFKFAEWERYGTASDYLQHYATRLAIAQFLNTSMITLAISFIAGNIWGPGGLIGIIYQVHRSNAIIPWITEIIDVNAIIQYYKRLQIRNSPDKSHIMMTQQELNGLFEYPKYDFSAKYAGYIKTIWSAAFFAPLVPQVIYWSIIGLFINYWIDKYIMLRRRSRGISYGSDLPIYLIEFLELTLVIFAIGNFFFDVFLTGFDFDQSILTIMGGLIGIANALLPMDEINEWLFPIKPEDITEDKYSDIKLTFLEDYDRSNPATAEIAMERYTKAKERQP